MLERKLACLHTHGLTGFRQGLAKDMERDFVRSLQFDYQRKGRRHDTSPVVICHHADYASAAQRRSQKHPGKSVAGRVLCSSFDKLPRLDSLVNKSDGCVLCNCRIAAVLIKPQQQLNRSGVLAVHALQALLHGANTQHSNELSHGTIS